MGELQELFEQIEAKVITILKTKMVGNEEIRRRTEDRFRGIIKKLKGEKMKYNTLKAKDMARGVIEKIWNKSNLENQLESYDNADDFEKDKKKIWNEFLKNTKGPAKDVEDIGRSFLEKKFKIVTQIIFKKNMRYKQQIQEKNQEINSLKSNLEQAHIVTEKKINEIKSEKIKHNTIKNTLEKKIAALKEEKDKYVNEICELNKKKKSDDLDKIKLRDQL